MIWSVIGDVYCSENSKTPGAAIDNGGHKSVGREVLKLNFGKHKKGLSHQQPGSLKIYLNSSGPPSACVVWLPWTDGLSTGNPVCHPVNVGTILFLLFFKFSSFVISTPETSVIVGTQEVSPPSQKSVTCCCITLRAEMCLWLCIHESLRLATQPHASETSIFCGSSLVFCWRDNPASAAPTRVSAGASGPRAPWLVAYFWFSIWHKGESLPQHQKRSRRGSFPVRPHAKPEAVRSTFAVQTVDQRLYFPALNNENKAA